MGFNFTWCNVTYETWPLIRIHLHNQSFSQEELISGLKGIFDLFHVAIERQEQVTLVIYTQSISSVYYESFLEHLEPLLEWFMDQSNRNVAVLAVQGSVIEINSQIVRDGFAILQEANLFSRPVIPVQSIPSSKEKIQELVAQ